MKRLWVACLAVLALAGCATTPLSNVGSSVADLPGWAGEDHSAAFAAVRAACAALRAPPSPRFCEDVRAAGNPGEGGARAFLETHLRAEPEAGEGVLTAYFSPDYDARAQPGGDFSAPVRPRPADLGATTPSRGQIDSWPASDALAWMRPEDLFFLQIQGSGVLEFADGRRARASFAGSNGRPFVAVAGPMAARGLIAPAHMSAGAIHDWLAAHRGPDADAVIGLNPRYIFFRLAPDTGRDPVGAAGVPLIAGRSVAVDPADHPWGELLWIDADAPSLAGAPAVFRRLAVALDSGAAIKGEVRADLYLGQGAAAGEAAGRVRHRLRLWRLRPVE